MNLKKRLFLANAATVLIPLVITLLLAFLYLSLYGRFAETDSSFQKYQRLSQIKFELLNKYHSEFQNNPQIIENQLFHEDLREELQALNGELAILKEDSVIYQSRSFSVLDIEKLNRAKNRVGLSEQVAIDNSSFIVQLIDLRYEDSSAANIFLLVPIDSSATNLKSFLIFIGAIFCLSFVVTNVIISYQLSNSIVKPLENLRTAADEISNGNLEQQIIEEGEQEIKELCRDLELMRIKLKELIHTQLKYEDNRRMLVSSISHDLKTPVTSIKGYIEGILDGIAATPEKMDRYLHTIYLKAEQVDSLIDDLLLYSKLDLNQIPFNMEKVDIEAYLQSCLAESEPELERNTINFSFASELNVKRYTLLDKERMKRVIMNIIDNSRKYMNKDRGEIAVALRETQTSLIVEFKDNGSGIKKEHLPYIFDWFYRSDGARTDIQGSGLGLAIAKQIVEGHQGKIWALSNEDEGTSILISLSKVF